MATDYPKVLKGDEAEDVWTERINAFWNGLLKALQILGPLLTALVLYMQSQTHTKIDEAKAEVKQVAVDAATNAKTAADESKAVKSDLAVATQERREEFKDIAEKQEADLRSWKAYHTKSPEDAEEAHRALEKAIVPNGHEVLSAKGSP